MPRGISLPLKKSFSPFVNLVTVKDILYQTLQRVQTVSRHPLKGLICNACLSESVFLTATISMPGLLITEVSPAGKWTERLWEGDRDERQLEKCKLCLDLIFSVWEQRQRQTLNSNIVIWRWKHLYLRLHNFWSHFWACLLGLCVIGLNWSSRPY